MSLKIERKKKRTPSVHLDFNSPLGVTRKYSHIIMDTNIAKIIHRNISTFQIKWNRGFFLLYTHASISNVIYCHAVVSL